MKKLLLFLCLIFLLISSSVWAIPLVNDVVQMSSNTGVHYEMIVENGDKYDTFCLERSVYYYNKTDYVVKSVSDYAELGGMGGQTEEGKDPVSLITIWLYASFFDGSFDHINDNRSELADLVQHAIWYVEDEYEAAEEAEFLGYYNRLASNQDTFTVTGWNIKAVNIVTFGGVDVQSQLVGEAAPVPEPATMFLLGTGLVGLAGLKRRKKNR